MERNNHQNRSFLYGDGFFETFRVEDGQISLLDFHLQRAQRTAEELKMKWPKDWNQAYFNNLIHGTKEKNILRVTFFRKGTGTYRTESREMDMAHVFRPLQELNTYFPTTFIHSEQLSQELDKLPYYSCSICDRIRKPTGDYFPSHIKSTSSMIYVLAAMELRESGTDDLILLNTEGNLCESLTGNILMSRNQQWFTPNKSEGPVTGVYLTFLKTFLQIIETNISEEDLLQADQTYLINSVHGFKKVRVITD